MYYITLKTQCELDDTDFQEIYDLLDESFEIGTVLTFDAEGNKIETIATMTTTDDGFEYDYDVANKVEVNVGNSIVETLGTILDCDFELDAPIIKEEGVSYED